LTLNAAASVTTTRWQLTRNGAIHRTYWEERSDCLCRFLCSWN